MRQEILETLPKLSDENFFGLSKQQINQIEAKLSQTSFEGIVARTPIKVDIATRQTLPVLIFRNTSSLRNWEVSPELNTHIVVSYFDNGTIYIGSAYEEQRKLQSAQYGKSMSGDRPNDENAKNLAAKVDVLDLRSLLRLPWQPANLAIYVIYYDWVSNALMTKLQSANKEIFSGSSSVNGGISLSIPEKVLEGKDIPVLGLVQMPADSIVLDKNGGPNVSGKLVVFELDRKEPFQVDVNISLSNPVIGESPSPQNQMIRGSFNFDLRQKMALTSGTYVVYLFVREYMVGPKKLIVEP